MKIEVRYFSRGGNTKKLAEAIAAGVGAEARGVEAPLESRADVVFLGASVYAGKPAPEVTAFIRKYADNIGTLVVFSSSASGKSTHGAVKAAAADCGVKTSEMYYHCPGAFLFLHKNRPNAQDCAAAAAFAKKQIGLIGVT